MINFKNAIFCTIIMFTIFSAAISDSDQSKTGKIKTFEEEQEKNFIILFDPGSCEIRIDEKEKLNRAVYNLNNKYTDGEIHLSSFTRNDEYQIDEDIANKRLNVIREYFVKNGLKDFRVSIGGNQDRYDSPSSNKNDGGRVIVSFSEGLFFKDLLFKLNTSDVINTNSLYFDMCLLRENPDRVVFLAACYYIKTESGFELGFQRALFVKNYFVQNGIDESRIFVASMEDVNPYDPLGYGSIMEIYTLGSIEDSGSCNKDGKIYTEYFERKIRELGTGRGYYWAPYLKTKEYLKKIEEEKSKK